MNIEELTPGKDRLTFEAGAFYGDHSRECELHTFTGVHDGSMGHKLIETKEFPNGLTSIWYRELQ